MHQNLFMTLSTYERRSSSVIQNLMNLHSEASPKVMAYFYFDFNDPKKQQLGDLLKSLTCQLAEASTAAFEILSKSYSDHRDGRSAPSIDAVSQALRDMFTVHDRFYIVIDALDESSERPELLSWLESLADAKPENVSILASSRPERDISDSLGPWVTHAIMLHKAIVDADIRVHVMEQLKIHPRLSKWSPDIKKKIESSLLVGAKGMYEHPP
jgi:hypothetical protein